MRSNSRFFSALILLAFIALPVTAAWASIIYCGDDPRQVALTFDDGPSFKYTMKVLDILKSEKVKATFFIVGQRAEQNPEILKMISDNGNELANHTYYHTRLSTISDEKMMDEIRATSSIIYKITGEHVAYFRPPFGVFNYRQRKLIEKAGYSVVLWSVHADDFYHLGWGMRTSRSIEKRVLRLVTGGDIILAHDDSDQIVKALPVIIEALKQRGYRFVTISQLNASKRTAKI